MASTGWISQNLRAVVDGLSAGTTVPYDVAEGYRWRIEMIYHEFLAKELLGELDESEREAMECVAEAYSLMSSYVYRVSRDPPPPLQPRQSPVILNGDVGRPSFEIPYCQLEYLVHSHFTVPQIASMLEVSVSTIRRRMSSYGLSIHQTYSNINDAELDAIVSDAQHLFPGWGNRQMYGYLVSRGIRIQQIRVRESQSRVDPEGSVMRRLHSIRRRQYSVQGPQHLWHIDGNHKLIRYSSTHILSVFNFLWITTSCTIVILGRHWKFYGFDFLFFLFN